MRVPEAEVGTEPGGGEVPLRGRAASLDGFTLHAATRAGALDRAGREALLRYVLRPPVAQERVEQRPGAHHPQVGLYRRHDRGGHGPAVAAAPAGHQCAAASPWRSRLAPQSPQAAAASDKPGRPDHAGGYRPWAELLARTFAVDVLACPRCQGRMRLLALVKGPASIARYLATVGEATEVPRRSPGRGPPYWKSRVLRRQVLGDEDEGGGRGSGAEEVA
jgi:hypothetical protein